jgi:hypothetical protein
MGRQNHTKNTERKRRKGRQINSTVKQKEQTKEKHKVSKKTGKL